MPVAKSDIKFYLTSLEPEIEQTIYSQSIGGHAAYISSDESKSLVYPSTTLGATANIYESSLNLSSLGDLSGAEKVFVNSELIDVQALSSTSVTVNNRNFNDRINTHLSGDIVYGVSLFDIFNNQFNQNRKQYRCIAFRNNNSTESAYNVSVYMKQSSQNPSSVLKIAVEMPSNDYLSSTATGGTSTKLDDSSLVDLYDDSLFTSANLRFTSGNNINQSRIVASYTSSSGTFTFSDAFPYAIGSGDAYEIDAGPSQRVAAGTIKPDTDSDRMTDFKIPNSDNAISINVNGSRTNTTTLMPNDIIYIWLERSLDRRGSAYNNNNCVITLRYTV